MTHSKILLAAAIGAAMAIAGAPVAAADTCDPAVTVCQGGDVDSGSGAMDAAPPVMASSGDQYPFDDEWYFNPAGGGTALQPNHGSSGGGSSGGGGGHR